MSDDAANRENLIRPLVRLLGVFFVVEGTSGLLGNGIDLLDQFRLSNQWQTEFRGGDVVAWTIASAFTLAAGLTLIFKSDLALDAVFHESLKTPEAEQDG